MPTENIFIAHPTTVEQIKALTEFVKTLKIKFEVTQKDTPYNPEFVNMVMEAESEIESGKGLKVSSDEFDNLWK